MKFKKLHDDVIESLGGYDKAREYLEMCENSVLPLCNIYALREHLLEYRRENGIFEVGDMIVFRKLPFERLFSVRNVGGDSIVIHEMWDEAGARLFSEDKPYLDIRHATDDEIEAGKRLP